MSEETQQRAAWGDGDGSDEEWGVEWGEEHDAPSFQAELLDAREARCAALPPNHKAWECE